MKKQYLPDPGGSGEQDQVSLGFKSQKPNDYFFDIRVGWIKRQRIHILIVIYYWWIRPSSLIHPTLFVSILKFLCIYLKKNPADPARSTPNLYDNKVVEILLYWKKMISCDIIHLVRDRESFKRLNVPQNFNCACGCAQLRESSDFFSPSRVDIWNYQ